MEFGLANGLAQDGQYDQRIQDMRYQHHALEQEKAKNEAKVKILADDLQFNNAMNPHDRKLIEEEATKTIHDIGEYDRKNPLWRSDVTQSAEMQRKLHALKTNDHLVRGLASDDAHKKYLADLAEVAKNPQAHDQEAYDEIGRQWDTYNQHGNQLGEQAKLRQGMQPFVYTKPKDFVDLPKLYAEAGKSINDFDVQKGAIQGEGWTKPKAAAVEAKRNQIYQANKRQIDLEAKKAGITDQNQLNKLIDQQIESGFDKKYWQGDADAAFRHYMQQQQLDAIKEDRGAKNEIAKKKLAEKTGAAPLSTWDQIFKQDAGVATAKDLKAALGKNPENIISLEDGTKADLTDFPVNYYDKTVKTSKGHVAPGYKKIPLKAAEQLGMVDLSDVWGTSDEVEDNWRDIATIEEGLNAKGEREKYVKVEVNIPLNPTDKKAKMNFDKSVGGAKYAREVLNTKAVESRPATIKQGNYTYTLGADGQYH